MYKAKQRRSTDMHYKLNVFNKVEKVATHRKRWKEHTRIATVRKEADHRRSAEEGTGEY
jgi:hypothetical protein